MANRFKVNKMCEHEWKQTDSYINSSFWVGCSKVEELIIEYTCTKCGEKLDRYSRALGFSEEE